jgi:PKD repeat protein
MNMKKIHFAAVAFLVALALNTRATVYYYCGAGNITATGSWWSASNCTGTHPNFANANNTYNFNTAGNYSLNGAWTIGSNCIINIGFGGAAVTLNTNGNSIKTSGAVHIVLNILANGTLNVTTSNFFAAANKIDLGTCSSGSTVNYNLANATVGAGTYDNLIISQNATMAGNVITTNNVFTNSAILTLGGGYITVAGSMAGAGTLSGDVSASFNYTGNGSQTLNMDQTTPGSTNVLFSAQSNGAGTLVLGTDLQIAPGGDITPFSGTIDASGVTVTLLADQVTVGNTGSIGSVGGSYIGNVTTQVYHNPSSHQTDWVTVGSPGITNADFTQWNAVFPITCLNCPDGYSTGGVQFGSITDYVEATDSYNEITNTTDALTVGKGWWVYMGTSSPGAPTAGELLTVSGSPNFGPFTYPVTAGGAGAGYNLLSNPFPSPISWSSVYNNNSGMLASSSYATWSPNLGDHSYYDAVSATSNPSSGNYVTGDIIPISMGFYVQANSSGNISFDELDKSQGTQPILRQAGGQQTQKVMLPKIGIQATGFGMLSEAVIVFNPTSTAGMDNIIDTKRIGGNAGWLALTSVVGGNNLAINGMPALTSNYSIPIKMTTATTGSYSIDALNLNRMPSGACIILHDNYTGLDYDMKQGPYSVTLNDTETVARFALNITIDNSLTITANSVQATCPEGGDAKLIAVGNDAGPWNYTWKDANSAVVRTSLNKASADTLANLGGGIYVVDVNTVGTCNSASQSFTLTLPAGITSAYSVSSNTVLVNNSVDFTDNSVNADAWYWDFGDTTYSTLQNPSHTYTATGTFDATLYAINTVCGDTMIGQYTSIDVLGATAVAAQANNEVYVSKDAAGTFIKFNYGAETPVSVSVYNALGQVLYSTPATRVSKEKIYLNLEQAHKQMLFISIVNLDNSAQLTKKIFND